MSLNPVADSDLLVQTPATSSSYPPRAEAYRAVAVLMLVQLLWAVDKHLITLLFPAIQADLHISDTQIGLLQGMAYAVCFSIMGLPCGWAADHWSRRNLIALGVAVWSVATMLCGLSHSYAELVVARMGVGLGEAVLFPTSLSMLSDYFPPHQRGRALGIYMSSTFLGGGGAYLVGGAVIGALSGSSGVTLPWVGFVCLWKAAFFVVGAPGIAFALLMFALREPRRVRAPVPAGMVGSATRRDSLWRYVCQRPAAFITVLGSYTLLTFVSFGVIAWMPTLLVRILHARMSVAGVCVGVVEVVAGIIGGLSAGALGDRWTRQGRRGAKFRLTLIWWIGVVPALALLSQAHVLVTATLCFALFFVLNSLGYVSGGAVVQDLVPPQLRGRATALWYFITAVVGQGGGPLATALVTDRVFANQAALPYSLVVMAAPAAVLGLALSWYGLDAFDRARLSADARVGEILGTH